MQANLVIIVAAISGPLDMELRPNGGAVVAIFFLNDAHVIALSGLLST